MTDDALPSTPELEALRAYIMPLGTHDWALAREQAQHEATVSWLAARASRELREALEDYGNHIISEVSAFECGGNFREYQRLGREAKSRVLALHQAEVEGLKQEIKRLEVELGP